MKRLLLFVTAVMILAACGSGSDSSSRKKKERFGWSDQTLYGDVKSVTKEQYVLEGEFGAETLGKLQYRYIYNFDRSHGNCTERIEYEYPNEHIRRYTYVYDSEGKCIEMKLRLGLSDKLLYAMFTYEYDSNGNLISSSDHGMQGNSYICFTSVYDNAGNCVESNVYDYDGSLAQKVIFKHDSNGNIVEEVRYNRDGELLGKFTYTLNSDNKWIEKNVFGSDGNLVQKGVAAYDDEGNRIVEVFDSHGEPIKKNIISYDTHKNQRESKSYTNIAGVWIPESIIKYEIEYFE